MLDALSGGCSGLACIELLALGGGEGPNIIWPGWVGMVAQPSRFLLRVVEDLEETLRPCCYTDLGLHGCCCIVI